LIIAVIYSTSRYYEVQEPHPQPPPISKVYPFLPPAAGGLRGCEEGLKMYLIRAETAVIFCS
jgi:hypothetical protein